MCDVKTTRSINPHTRQINLENLDNNKITVLSRAFNCPRVIILFILNLGHSLVKFDDTLRVLSKQGIDLSERIMRLGETL